VVHERSAISNVTDDARNAAVEWHASGRPRPLGRHFHHGQVPVAARPIVALSISLGFRQRRSAHSRPGGGSGGSGDGHSSRGLAAQSRMTRQRNDGTRLGFVRLAEVLGRDFSVGFELLRSSAAPAKLTL